ncbi:MAG: UDP-N-acetylmuramoyl-L-alanine--D-glutamate ligase [Patescibacteria group bacterium]
MKFIDRIIEPGPEILELQARAADEISTLLPASVVEAIGSMSVPLAGKEEIDMMVITDDVEGNSKILESNGYRQGPVVKGISYLKRKEKGIEIAPQVIPKGHKMIGIHHLIIQKLRNNNELRERYKDLKKSLVGSTVEEYKEKKNAWIRQYLLNDIKLNNMDYKEYFKGKMITQLGLGLLGRGLGDAIFLAECGAELIVTDLKTEEELKTSVEKLKKYSNIILHLGGHNLDDFINRDFILKGAGVPLDSIYIEEARKNNIPIEMDSSLCVRLLPEKVITIGVTGTRGKSTVTHMIYNALRETADPSTIHLGGNVRDMATLSLLPKIKSGDVLVLELDSWQLQGFGENKISPNIAVITNFMVDHQNYYPDMDTYFKDKANIFLYQKLGDRLIVGKTVLELVKKLNPPVTPEVPEEWPEDWKLKIPGEHNKENAELARAVLQIPDKRMKEGLEPGTNTKYFLEPEETWSTLTGFIGVEGRLQLIKETNGVKIYNDNNATTPEATIVGLKALGSNIVLICGGADKNLDLKDLINEINKTCKTIILLPGSGSQKLTANSLQLTAKITPVQNLSEAVTKAIEEAQSGDIILFSPAFASFGLFKNEYERNDEFMKTINELK